MFPEIVSMEGSSSIFCQDINIFTCNFWTFTPFLLVDGPELNTTVILLLDVVNGLLSDCHSCPFTTCCLTTWFKSHNNLLFVHESFEEAQNNFVVFKCQSKRCINFIWFHVIKHNICPFDNLSQ